MNKEIEGIQRIQRRDREEKMYRLREGHMVYVLANRSLTIPPLSSMLS